MEGSRSAHVYCMCGSCFKERSYYEKGSQKDAIVKEFLNMAFGIDSEFVSFPLVALSFPRRCPSTRM